MARTVRQPGNKLKRLNAAFNGINRLRQVATTVTPQFNPDSFDSSQARLGENPVDFAGIWANDGRTLASIREKAWPKRNVK